MFVGFFAILSFAACGVGGGSVYPPLAWKRAGRRVSETSFAEVDLEASVFGFAERLKSLVDLEVWFP